MGAGIGKTARLGKKKTKESSSVRLTRAEKCIHLLLTCVTLGDLGATSSASKEELERLIKEIE